MNKRREKFVSLAEKRTQKAIDFIRLLGNLANTRNYSYDEKDVKKIITALNTELKSLKEKFSNEEGEKSGKFKL
ncbi:hypothetical protein N8574_01875 [Akkermansiaceae bacterium]|nr:hypothetical protein [Akkermansiaceae bacterium]